MASEADALDPASSEPLLTNHTNRSTYSGDNGVSSDAKATTISLRGTDVFVGRGDDRAHILFDIHANFYPGTCTAIMGPSGSGKSTLLNCICGHSKIAQAEPEGTIFENGERLDASDFANRLSYVPQKEALLAVMTSHELLTYSARLRFDENDEDRKDRIADVLHTVEMYDKKDVVIGDVHEVGLSGGQRKRVSIAMELLADRPVMFLDEPTSGLDSCMAKEVTLSLYGTCSLLADMCELLRCLVDITVQLCGSSCNSLHLLRLRSCSQKLAPPHSLHLLRSRPC